MYTRIDGEGDANQSSRDFWFIIFPCGESAHACARRGCVAYTQVREVVVVVLSEEVRVGGYKKPIACSSWAGGSPWPCGILVPQQD